MTQHWWRGRRTANAHGPILLSDMENDFDECGDFTCSVVPAHFGRAAFRCFRFFFRSQSRLAVGSMRSREKPLRHTIYHLGRAPPRQSCLFQVFKALPRIFAKRGATFSLTTNQIKPGARI